MVKVGWNMVESSVWEKKSFLTECVASRNKARKRHPHLTFDCFKAKAVGQVAVCSAGRSIGAKSSGSMSLTSALKGRTPSVCDLCLEFDGE